MNCPPEVLGPILKIIEIGIIHIRSFGWDGNAARCALEADHIHNLPGLLISYSPEVLKYYLDVEQPIFIKNTAGVSIGDFKPYWKALDDFAKCQQQSPNGP